MKNSAFERYSPFIQNYIYSKGWLDLRDVQVEACEAIFDSDSHVIIASGTSSGKTEAAFFPILTLLEKNPSSSIGVIYIGPLKALINDQFKRLNDLLKDNHIPVWPWHGDISQSVKNRALKSAKGILQITPESLEAMLMKHRGTARVLFHDLRFVIIDEIHALIGNDRGLQVMCLLQRLETLTKNHPRRIALSATLKDYSSAMSFLALGSNKNTVPVGIAQKKRTISIGVKAFEYCGDEASDTEITDNYYNFIYNHSHFNKCLIFANSRKMVEAVIAKMKSIAKSRYEKDVFYAHHGSLSALIRGEAEEKLKCSIGPVVTAATLTLELGIDIGDLDLTIQLGSPRSCSSFVQRLGRSGRRTGKSTMLFVNEVHSYTGNTILERIPWDLVQTIAVIQLYIEEKWVEPFQLKPKPYSLLIHQTLSILGSYGELSPVDLAKIILNLAVFKNKITPEEFKDILRHLVNEDIIQILEDGSLIIGMKGERITNHYSFYAVFESNEGFHVISKEGEIGTLDNLPDVGECFILAGSAWKVTDVDADHKKVFVVRAKNLLLPKWGSGMIGIHGRIIKKMHEILITDKTYPYLEPGAQRIIDNIRNELKISGVINNTIYKKQEHEFIFLPWCGTKELYTIYKLFSNAWKGLLKITDVIYEDYYITINSSLSYDRFVYLLKTAQVDMDDYKSILSGEDFPGVDKYDYMLPKEYRKKSYYYNEMAVADALQIISSL